MKTQSDTGRIIRIHAESFGNELAGIKAAAEMIGEALAYRESRGEWPNWMNGARMGGLLGLVETSADSAYRRLVLAFGDEAPLVNGWPADGESAVGGE